MKRYEKPVVVVNEALAEGVYAASGDCWSVSWTMVQDYVDGYKIFEIYIQHSDQVTHISDASTVVFTFNYAIAVADAQGYDYSLSGTTVTVTRKSLADSYYTGDQATYKLKVGTGDEATTKALEIVGANISCTKSVNVQGGGADEIG